MTFTERGYETKCVCAFNRVRQRERQIVSGRERERERERESCPGVFKNYSNSSEKSFQNKEGFFTRFFVASLTVLWTLAYAVLIKTRNFL